MRIGERRRRLDAALAEFRALWHPQPFCEIRPDWCRRWPELAAEVLALPEDAVAALADDGAAALRLLARHLPAAAELLPLAELPAGDGAPLPDYGPHWAWEIPGRKRAQIEAFAAAAAPGGEAILDWCGGKGHLGRLLALHSGLPATSLEIDPALCAEGGQLARRAGVRHAFVVADALTGEGALAPGQHAVALHACGELHRHLVRHAPARGVAALDVAPCCYYRGVEAVYEPLADGVRLRLSRDDTRLAVTETVTAAPRQARRRDRDMAWKLGFDAWRRQCSGEDRYRPFKPVPPAWLAGDFAAFLARMAAREGLPAPTPAAAIACERRGWERQGEVMRLSIVRYAFRRPLEIWLALDLAAWLERAGYAVGLATFCPRRLTPRNLLVSARR